MVQGSAAEISSGLPFIAQSIRCRPIAVPFSDFVFSFEPGTFRLVSGNERAFAFFFLAIPSILSYNSTWMTGFAKRFLASE